VDTLRSIVTQSEAEASLSDSGPEGIQKSKQFPGRRDWWMLFGVIALVCLVATRNLSRGEFDYNVDEAQHAVTGLFIADALRDVPLRHPAHYAYNYYVQYPGVAIVHWPPLFYFFEGLAFIVFGPSPIAARLTILLFTVLLLFQWFRLVEELQDSYTAAVSTAILGLVPMVMLFEKTVMLEIPSLALGVTAIRYWMKYLNDASKKSLYLFVLWLSAALLCKQTNVYLLIFCFLTLLVTGKWKRIFSASFLWAVGLGCLLVGPFYGLMAVTQGRAMANDLGSHQMSGWMRLTFYLRTLPLTLTVPLLLLSLVGILFAKRWNRAGQAVPMVCWILAGYITFTLFGQAESRFAIYWVPPLVYFAAGFLTQCFHLPKVRLAMRGSALLLVGFLGIRAWAYERPYISGYKDAASKLVTTYHSGIVLFDGKVPGNFVFYMRALDPQRQFIVLRKSLYVSDIRTNQNSEELLRSRQELLDLFRRDGIRFAVVLENAPLQFESQRELRELLQSQQFRLVDSFPIVTNEPSWRGQSLRLYENMQWAPPADKFLKIRMMTLNQDIVVPLDEFDFVKGKVQATKPEEK
jgi:4-amino-4-deoxy-L-arabinose transferase-like glycosyltransferase